MVECIWEGCVVVTGLWRGLVVSVGLNALPQAPCVSAVCEMIIDFIAIRKHEVLKNFLVDGCADCGLQKTQWTNTSR